MCDAVPKRDKVRVQDIEGIGREDQVLSGGDFCYTYRFVYRRAQRDRTIRLLVILSTIYSTTILAGDAIIGIIHSERARSAS